MLTPSTWDTKASCTTRTHTLVSGRSFSRVHARSPSRSVSYRRVLDHDAINETKRKVSEMAGDGHMTLVRGHAVL